MSPTHLSPGARAAGVPAHEVGAGVDVVGGDGGAGLPARLRGSQLLLAHDGGGPCPPRPSRPCGAARRRARRYPQNHVRGAQLGFDHQGRLPPSDLRGGVGPAQPARSIRTPGTPSRLAHGCDGAVAFFAADEPRGACSPTFFRKQGLWSGGPGESHPRAPTEPCLTVSRYTALVILGHQNDWTQAQWLRRRGH